VLINLLLVRIPSLVAENFSLIDNEFCISFEDFLTQRQNSSIQLFVVAELVWTIVERIKLDYGVSVLFLVALWGRKLILLLFPVLRHLD
jgi:hypothetical protein